VIAASKALRWTATLLCVGALAACSKDGKVKEEPPAELVKFDETVRVDRIWQASLGGEKPVMRLGLALGVHGERAYASSANGDVAAFDLKSGRTIWRTDTKAALGGGTGAGAELVAVGTRDGEIIALGAATGAIRWRVPVSGEVLAAPAVSDAVVVVRTVDGKLTGLAAADGKALWSEEQQVPRLSLRGTSRPLIVGDTAICGFDNGRVLSLSLADGSVLWDVAVAPARGRSELERLNDIDAQVRAIDDDLYVVGFQGRAAMLARDSGQIWWSRDVSSYRGLDVDAEDLVVSTADGDLIALQRRTGTETWRTDSLKRRALSSPTLLGSLVAVADFEGYVHWFDKRSGKLVARTSVGDRVSNPPVAAEGLLLVISDKGQIAAFRPREPEAVPAAEG
jgi:outer membrane protein assembly factor BamB